MAEEPRANVRYNYDGVESFTIVTYPLFRNTFKFTRDEAVHHSMAANGCRPKSTNISAALCFYLPAYALECSVTLRDVGIWLTRAGYAVHGIDYEGHGKSSGLEGYIDSFDDVVNDCCSYFTKMCERQENKGKKGFLFGESMGGTVALLLHRRMPDYWDGAVLVAPMCKLADEMKPGPFLMGALNALCKIVPTRKLVITQDVIEQGIKSPEKRAKARSNPHCYKGRPRLRTGSQLMNASLEIEKHLDQISFPFLIVHGEQDIITDPSGSKLLYESASSADKTYNLYPGMWHAITTGEMPEGIRLVLTDITSWLDKRSTSENSSRTVSEEEEVCSLSSQTQTT